MYILYTDFAAHYGVHERYKDLDCESSIIMNPYPAPSSITMQRTGEAPMTITLEDAVVIMTNQQKTIEELISNNQRMFQYIQEAQRMGGFGNIQFAQQNLSDPASHVFRGGAGAGTSSEPVREKPMTLNEYLAMKKSQPAAAAAAAAPASIPAPSTLSSTPPAPTATKPMTLSEFLAQRKSTAPAAAAAAAAAAPTSETDAVPVFDTPSKCDPVV